MLLQGGDHVGGRELAGGQLGGIEPDAHGVLALAEDDDVADARNALQRVLHVDVEVVGDVLVREAVVGRIEAGGKDEIRVRLGDGDAGVLDFLRKPAECGGDAVLHVDGGDVQVVARAEGDVDAAGAVVGAGRGDVVHALDAVDLLLQRNGDRRLHHLRIGADVVAGDVDLRRSQVRIERDWQRGNADGSRKNDQERADRRKNGSLNKKINQTGSPLLYRPRRQSACPQVLASLLVEREYRRSGTAYRRR